MTTLVLISCGLRRFHSLEFRVSFLSPGLLEWQRGNPKSMPGPNFLKSNCTWNFAETPWKYGEIMELCHCGKLRTLPVPLPIIPSQISYFSCNIGIYQ